MYQVSNFTENDDVKVLSELGAFQIIEYQRDLSVSPSSAVTAYFSAQMNVKKRQLVCHLHKSHLIIDFTMFHPILQCVFIKRHGLIVFLRVHTSASCGQQGLLPAGHRLVLLFQRFSLLVALKGIIRISNPGIAAALPVHVLRCVRLHLQKKVIGVDSRIIVL